MNKGNFFKTLCLSAAMAFCGINANAQLEQSVFLNGNLPTAEFNDAVSVTPANAVINGFTPMNRIDAGTNADPGFGMGYRLNYSFDVGFGEVAPYLNADFQWNQIKGKVRDEYTNARCRAPQYFNIPIMLGVQYRYTLTDIFKLFGELGLGYDVFMITSSGWKGDAPLPFYKYNVGGAMCWQIGAGSFFGSHVSAGLHYYGLGKHTIEFNKNAANTDIVDGNNNVIDDGTQVVQRNLGSLMLRIGFHF